MNWTDFLLGMTTGVIASSLCIALVLFRLMKPHLEAAARAKRGL